MKGADGGVGECAAALNRKADGKKGFSDSRPDLRVNKKENGMRGENSWRNLRPLVQKAGCEGCALARKEGHTKRGNFVIVKEACKFGGRIAVEEGQKVRPSCYR